MPKSFDDVPRDACGVFGIYDSPRAAWLAYIALHALQHRGQESAGIAVSDGERMRHHVGMGLVTQAFSESHLASLRGRSAIGHTRYSTTGASTIDNAQPLLARSETETIFIAHNGNIANADRLRRELSLAGYPLRTTSDSEVIGALLVSSSGDNWAERIARVSRRLIGSYSLVVLTPRELIGVRDPFGIRPLCLGKSNEATVIASESCALDAIGAEWVRDVHPGEIITVSEHGLSSSTLPSIKSAGCLFEYIYLARPDSRIDGRLVYDARREMGYQLAKEHPVEADAVLGVPESAIMAAHGFAEASGIPYRDWLLRNRYSFRTFIQPDPELRQLQAQLKYHALPGVVAGQRLVVVDDTIVRGTTQRELIAMLRRLGAREIHLRISAPPVRHPCPLGVSIAREDELLAHQVQDLGERCRRIGADSLAYLSLEGLCRAIGRPPSTFCTGCLTGQYPIDAVAETREVVLAGEARK